MLPTENRTSTQKKNLFGRMNNKENRRTIFIATSNWFLNVNDMPTIIIIIIIFEGPQWKKRHTAFLLSSFLWWWKIILSQTKKNNNAAWHFGASDNDERESTFSSLDNADEDADSDNGDAEDRNISVKLLSAWLKLLPSV